ncbi:hypothetical protein DP939_28070 [Spongiactinospora rosea]|uniref:Uncharacterized protein n=1 Tax=Spongiactinospora rosea TaxID=2248750 RepID=A0A366LSM0_9ACTN|nr:hypothetical protein DP939_28070 [Spongiactinospora rosea]
MGETDIVVMGLDEYESLLGARRQAGAQASRIKVLRLQLDQAQACLAAIEELVRAGHTVGDGCAQDCLGCAVTAALSASHVQRDRADG